MKKLFLLMSIIICHTTNFMAQNEIPYSGDTLGVVNLSVANVRDKPSHSAEMVTQVLLGSPVKVLDKRNGWLKIKTSDGYTGWTNSSVQSLDRSKTNDWNTSSLVIFTQIYGSSYSEADSKSEPVSDLVCGCLLKQTGTEKGFYRVVYPDGRIAYISQKESMPYIKWKQSLSLTQENIIKTARTFMGIPYLWGGTSAKGMDCSGFAKTVYSLNGVVLLRDASQQAQGGSEVNTSKGFDQLEPGDLLFFGEKAKDGKPEKIVHVAISLGKTEFIHASGMIRTSSLNPVQPNYDEHNFKRFIRAKRIIGSVDGVNCWMLP